jgi:hypothetical protein
MTNNVLFPIGPKQMSTLAPSLHLVEPKYSYQAPGITTSLFSLFSAKSPDLSLDEVKNGTQKKLTEGHEINTFTPEQVLTAFAARNLEKKDISQVTSEDIIEAAKVVDLYQKRDKVSLPLNYEMISSFGENYPEFKMPPLPQPSFFSPIFSTIPKFDLNTAIDGAQALYDIAGFSDFKPEHLLMDFTSRYFQISLNEITVEHLNEITEYFNFLKKPFPIGPTKLPQMSLVFPDYEGQATSSSLNFHDVKVETRLKYKRSDPLSGFTPEELLVYWTAMDLDKKLLDVTEEDLIEACQTINLHGEREGKLFPLSRTSMYPMHLAYPNYDQKPTDQKPTSRFDQVKELLHLKKVDTSEFKLNDVIEQVEKHIKNNDPLSKYTQEEVLLLYTANCQNKRPNQVTSQNIIDVHTSLHSRSVCSGVIFPINHDEILQLRLEKVLPEFKAIALSEALKKKLPYTMGDVIKLASGRIKDAEGALLAELNTIRSQKKSDLTPSDITDSIKEIASRFSSVIFEPEVLLLIWTALRLNKELAAVQPGDIQDSIELIQPKEINAIPLSQISLATLMNPATTSTLLPNRYDQIQVMNRVDEENQTEYFERKKQEIDDLIEEINEDYSVDLETEALKVSSQLFEMPNSTASTPLSTSNQNASPTTTTRERAVIVDAPEEEEMGINNLQEEDDVVNSFVPLNEEHQETTIEEMIEEPITNPVKPQTPPLQQEKGSSTTPVIVPQQVVREEPLQTQPPEVIQEVASVHISSPVGGHVSVSFPTEIKTQPPGILPEQNPIEVKRPSSLLRRSTNQVKGFFSQVLRGFASTFSSLASYLTRFLRALGLVRS